jgi:outer membrane protein
MPTLRSFNTAIHCIKSLALILVVIGGVLLPMTSQAYHLPLWELGLGAGVLNAPHYRGSKTVEVIYLPVPYPTYRGDWLKVDEDGIRGKLFETNRVRLDFSLAGNIPVPKSDDSARAGMPSLDPLGEIGPELEINLWESSTGVNSIWFNIPYRLVFSVGNPLIDFQGWSFSPYINFESKMRQFNALTKYSLSFGPIFADNKYHDYFYKVESQYVTPDRSEYNAESGYSGSRITLSMTRNTRKYFFGMFARYDNLENAIFTDSPLVETNHYFIFGVAFSWIFFSSSTTVPH